MRLLLLPGDGIGPEITAAARAVLETLDRRHGLGLSLEERTIGLAALRDCGSTLPDAVLDAARAADGIVLGPVSHLDYPAPADGGINPSGTLRKRLDLYANIRPALTWAGLPSPTGAEFDLVIYRENTEGFYADRNMAQGPGEMLVTEDVAVSLRRVTRQASLRIAEAAFAGARQRRRHVTAVHKANVLRLGDGLFLDCCRQVAARNPDVTYDELIVDAAAAHLVRHPGRFDVILTTNMFGDILSDLASELTGSLGLAASLNMGESHAMAQAQHGSAPDIAGQDRANPVSLLGSVAMLLVWRGARDGRGDLVTAAESLQAALAELIRAPGTRTADLGGPLGTRAFTERLVAALG